MTLIHTVHLLQRLQGKLDSLPVADIAHKLLKLEGGPGCTSSLLGSKHIVCWGFEDMLRPNVDDSNGEDKDKEKETKGMNHWNWPQLLLSFFLKRKSKVGHIDHD